MRKVYKSRRDRRRTKIRARLTGTANRPRLVVFRSNKYIYGQLVDDGKEETLVAVSDRKLGAGGKKPMKVARAGLVGERLGQEAKIAGIKKVVFDRAGYKYHGRIKALAESARRTGLEF